MPASVPAVELLALGRVFGTDPPVVALREVDLTLPRGTSLAILGPSGSGKSTLLNLLGCLDRQTSGTYLLDGIDVGELGDDERAALRAERIGFVFQSFNLLAHRPVVENVMLAEVYRGGPARAARTGRWARSTRWAWAHRASFLPTRLSGGEQQRVAVARALLGNPTLLLCDEPTGNLDSANTDAVLALFDDLRDGRADRHHGHARGPRRRARAPARADHRRAPERGAGVTARRRPARADVPRARMRTQDLVAEALAGLLARPARVALTVLGTVIGVGALVATLGLSKTAGNQIVGRFDALSATDVVISPSARGGRRRRHGPALGRRGAPAPAQRRGRGRARSPTSTSAAALVRAVAAQRPARRGGDPAADQGRVARRCSARCGPSCRPGASSTRATPAAPTASLVLGPGAARRVGITRVDQQPAVFIGDRLYTVVGLLSGVRRQSVAAGGGDHAGGDRPTGVRPAGARARPGRDADRRRRADRPPGARPR